MSLRSTMLGLLDLSGTSRALLTIRKAAPQWLTVITWHRIDDPRAASDVDDNVIDATPSEFAAQVDVLAKNFTIVGLDQVRGALAGGTLPPNPALITFDDGYLDGHTHALPILTRAGARATFFIATGAIEGRVPFWWDRVAWIVKHARRSRFALSYPSPRSFDLGEGGACTVVEECLRVIKTTHGLDVDRFVDHLADAADAPWGDEVRRDLAERLLMTWDHVRALHRAGMDIASHTRTHRVLGMVPDAELDAELTGARDDIERETGHRTTAIAYPVGAPAADVPRVRRALERAGYDLGFTYRTGFQPLGGELDRYAVRRIAVDGGTSRRTFRARLATLGVFG